MSKTDVIFVRRGLNPDTQKDDDEFLYSDISTDDPEFWKGTTPVLINAFKALYLTDEDSVKFHRAFVRRSIEPSLIVVVTDDFYPNDHLHRRVSASKETVTFLHNSIMYVVDKSYVDRNPNAFNFTLKPLPEPERPNNTFINNHYDGDDDNTREAESPVPEHVKYEVNRSRSGGFSTTVISLGLFKITERRIGENVSRSVEASEYVPNGCYAAFERDCGDVKYIDVVNMFDKKTYLTYRADLVDYIEGRD